MIAAGLVVWKKKLVSAEAAKGGRKLKETLSSKKVSGKSNARANRGKSS